MMPELGQMFLILALLLAATQALVPMLGAHLNDPALMRLARPAACGVFVFVAGAYAILTLGFVHQDFSIAYVAQNSNLMLPEHYRFTAVWGAHEGSLLLWVLILSVWTVTLAVLGRKLPERFMARALATMGALSAGFIGFSLFTSNPFERHVPPLADGNDLNPLLQDFGMIVHPPMLYVGYVGFAVAFAFAVAALLDGRVDREWVRWSRPWTNVAWSFLTLGIALGSWWAYYELGWGGWWFWDPVENASFMPWLVGTALIHSQAVTEKRGTFAAWTLLLAIAAFSLSLLGAFLVRSGVLTSVHAFTSDPARGTFVLIFLGIVAGGALSLYAMRAPRIQAAPPVALYSRESLLLTNNILLATACAMVLIGTLYPLVAELFGWGKISVGPPYFGLMFFVLMAPLVLLVPLGPLTRWKGDSASAVLRTLRGALALAAVLAALAWIFFREIPLTRVAGILAGAWVMLGTLHFVFRRVRSAPPGRRLTAEMLGMSLAHFGVGMFVVGVLVTESLNVERDLRMKPGDSVEVAGHEVRFVDQRHHQGPNFIADEGVFEIRKNGELIAERHPQKRQYLRGQVMTEAAITPGFFADFYIAMGEPLDGGAAWAVRLYYKPLVRWIWLGALLMMLGGFVAAGERRLRRAFAAREPVATEAGETLSPAARAAAESA
ncbi:MAG: heme lyase CcmF/NrfE family subunit [Xanthomonadales bacterium]|nr:Cytochrome c-type biogenesis protein CcmF [Xanthomonadales bacterium]MCC6593445.1 heme lyase CcmF/NrfE family subunit [Xanthomonadales bacterium]MCE7929786.1 heme lyase CcmF/NrfE family subunit [Xanthomonadales bacterium PRO6]